MTEKSSLLTAALGTLGIYLARIRETIEEKLDGISREIRDLSKIGINAD